MPKVKSQKDQQHTHLSDFIHCSILQVLSCFTVPGTQSTTHMLDFYYVSGKPSRVKMKTRNEVVHSKLWRRSSSVVGKDVCKEATWQLLGNMNAIMQTILQHSTMHTVQGRCSGVCLYVDVLVCVWMFVCVCVCVCVCVSVCLFVCCTVYISSSMPSHVLVRKRFWQYASLHGALVNRYTILCADYLCLISFIKASFLLLLSNMQSMLSAVCCSNKTIVVNSFISCKIAKTVTKRATQSKAAQPTQQLLLGAVQPEPICLPALRALAKQLPRQPQDPSGTHPAQRVPLAPIRPPTCHPQRIGSLPLISIAAPHNSLSRCCRRSMSIAGCRARQPRFASS